LTRYLLSCTFYTYTKKIHSIVISIYIYRFARNLKYNYVSCNFKSLIKGNNDISIFDWRFIKNIHFHFPVYLYCKNIKFNKKCYNIKQRILIAFNIHCIIYSFCIFFRIMRMIKCLFLRKRSNNSIECSWLVVL